MSWQAEVGPSHAISDGAAGGGGDPLAAALLLEQLPIGVIVVDYAERIQHANTAAQRLCHLPESGDELRPLGELCPLSGLHDLVAEAQTAGTTVVRERVTLEDAAEIRELRMTATALPATPSVLLTLEERPTASEEHQRIAEELARLQAEHAAQRARFQRLRDEFIAIASHELRTPLTALVGYTYLLDQEARKTTALVGVDHGRRLQRIVAVLQDQLARLVRLVDNVVDVGRLQTGRLALDQETVDLQPLLGRVVSDFNLVTATPPVTVTSPDAPLLVRGDAERLAQVVEEILHNAAAYAGAGGMAVRLTRESGCGQSTARIAITDQGVGISAEDQTNIFRPFFQVEPWNRRGRSGMGLGLYLARQIVEQHGGALTLVSEPGQGSTFTVALPLHGV